MTSSIRLKTWLRPIVCLAVFAFMTVTGSSLHAAYCDTGANSTNLIGNCGFENSTSSLTLWNVSGTPGLGTASPAPNGDTQYALLASTSFSSVFQVISGLIPGDTYAVSFQYFTTLTITSIGYLINDSNGIIYASSSISPLAPAGIWSLKTAQFVAGNAPITIRFYNSGEAGGQLKIDNVIVTAVPEPASMLLLGSLCSAVVAYRKRLRR